MTAPDSAKSALRRAATATRRARPAVDIEAARSAICSVVDAAWSPGWHCVAAYEPLPSEPGSSALLELLRRRADRVLVPVRRVDDDLGWRVWPDGSDLGVAAIRDAQLVLVPALAVDARGHRLGRGGGSYDRALARLMAPTRVAALLFDGETVDRLPADPWDVPVDSVITPTGWLSLTSPGQGLDAE